MSPLEWVGLVPAAGQATRLGPLPCSKEIYPLVTHEGFGGPRVRVACAALLEGFVAAGVDRAFVVLGQGKWDIPAFLDEGAPAGLALAYLTIRRSPSTCHTVDRAFPFTRGAMVAFGFPDIVFEPVDALGHLRAHQEATGADVVLGLFPAERPEKMDMVDTDTTGRVRRVVIKPARTRLRDTWILAVWTPAFTEFLHERMAKGGGQAGRELYVGDLVQAAIDEGWRVDGLGIADGRYRDIGTPEDLAAATEPLPEVPR